MRLIPLLTLLFAASPASVTIPIPGTGQAAVSATAVRDDATAWIAVATPEPWRSEVLHVNGSGVQSRIAVPNAIVKEIRPLADGRLAVTVTDSRGPSFRIVDDHFRPSWDSRDLPRKLLASDEQLVRFNDDGTRWALLTWDDDQIAITVGSTKSHTPETTTTLRPKAAPVEGVYDSVDVAFTSAEDIAVLWRGRVYVLEDSTRLTKTLAPGGGAAFLEWDARTRTLAAFTTNSTSTFRVDGNDRKPAAIGPGRDRPRGTRTSPSGNAWLDVQHRTVTLHRR
ncbi:MAG TPA: hypothetical protein VF618_20810 [Thermoanaerobaculia bacterium]